MNLLNKYTKPAKSVTHDSATSRLSLTRLARAAAARGHLFSVCAWCHPPSLNPDLHTLDNISHGICRTCGDAEMRRVR